MRGLDRQLRVWLTGNVAGPLLLYLCHTDLTRHMSGVPHFKQKLGALQCVPLKSV